MVFCYGSLRWLRHLLSQNYIISSFGKHFSLCITIIAIFFFQIFHSRLPLHYITFYLWCPTNATSVLSELCDYQMILKYHRIWYSSEYHQAKIENIITCSFKKCVSFIIVIILHCPLTRISTTCCFTSYFKIVLQQL